MKQRTLRRTGYTVDCANVHRHRDRGKLSGRAFHKHCRPTKISVHLLFVFSVFNAAATVQHGISTRHPTHALGRGRRNSNHSTPFFLFCLRGTQFHPIAIAVPGAKALSEPSAPYFFQTDRLDSRSNNPSTSQAYFQDPLYLPYHSLRTLTA
jgi:hypothetical protein